MGIAPDFNITFVGSDPVRIYIENFLILLLHYLSHILVLQRAWHHPFQTAHYQKTPFHRPKNVFFSQLRPLYQFYIFYYQFYPLQKLLTFIVLIVTVMVLCMSPYYALIPCILCNVSTPFSVNELLSRYYVLG